jgi:hypothetical protein
MVQVSEQEKEKLWWMRYVYQRERDAASQDGTQPRQEEAFFYACDEAALQRCLAGWLRHIKREAIVIQAIEQVPLDFRLQREPGLLQELPEGSRIVQVSIVFTGRKRRRMRVRTFAEVC